MINTCKLIILLLYLIHAKSNAQDSMTIRNWNDRITLGLGFGNDYGNIGANILFYAHKNFGIFAGIGYAIAGPGSTIGIKMRLLSQKTNSGIIPYALAMYGYNTGIWIIGEGRYNKLFYGPTFGLGFDYKSKVLKKYYLSFSLQVPVKNQKYQNYKDDLIKNHGIEFQYSLPFDLSLGFRFIIGAKH